MTYNGRSYLAVVPAYNEATTVGERRARRCASTRREFDVLVVDDGSTDALATSRDAGRRARAAPFRSTSASAAPCRPASSTRSSTATTTWSRSTATASTTRTRSSDCSSRMRRGPDARHGLRLALPRPTTRLPRAGQPPHRDPHLRVPAVAHRRPARERPDLGLPALQPPRDRAVRARLPARLPGGRGGADAALPPAADARGAGADVRSAAAASRRSPRASPSTTWSRCCSRSSSAWRAARPVVEPGDDAPVAAASGI